MTAKSRSSLERLWDIEDEFGALVGTAIGTVRPVSLTKATPRRTVATNQGTEAQPDPKAVLVFSQDPERFGAQGRKSYVARFESESNSRSEELSYRDALYQISSVYWRPIFSFIQRRGHSFWDAQDLTQDFFLTVLEGNLLKQGILSRGRFRALLLNLLKQFLINAKSKKKGRERREVQFISWDEWISDSPSTMFAPRSEATNWTAELTFDIRWAATIVERALRRLAEEYTAKGQRRLFDALNHSLTAERSDIRYADLAKRTGTDEAGTKRLIHELRRRYQSLLREEVAQTVEKPTDIDEEIRYLCKVLVGADKETNEAVWNKWLSSQSKALAAIKAELWGKARLSRARAHS
jgi:RNA polymerase sigma-70 factor (ECF subfamily)